SNVIMPGASMPPPRWRCALDRDFDEAVRPTTMVHRHARSIVGEHQNGVVTRSTEGGRRLRVRRIRDRLLLRRERDVARSPVEAPLDGQALVPRGIAPVTRI